MLKARWKCDPTFLSAGTDGDIRTKYIGNEVKFSAEKWTSSETANCDITAYSSTNTAELTSPTNIGGDWVKYLAND